MARVGLKLYGTTKYLDDGKEEVLGTLNGLVLCQTGPFIYAKGEGGITGTRSVAIPRLCPPAAVGQANAKYAHCCGVVDSDVWGLGAIAVGATSATSTTTGAGTFECWDLPAYHSSRPYMVGLLGDGKGADYLSMKLYNTTKTGFLPSAQDNPTGVLRRVERIIIPKKSGVNGTITASKWGSTVVLNLCGVSNFSTSTSAVLGTLPEGWRPNLYSVPIIIGPHNTKLYPSGWVNNITGEIWVGNLGRRGMSNIWGCGIFCTEKYKIFNNPIWTKTDVKMYGTTKSLLRISDESYKGSFLYIKDPYVAPANDDAYLNLYRVGNFVYGYLRSFDTGRSSSSYLSGNTVLTIPDGWRPAEDCYSSGFGAQTDTVGKTSPLSPFRVSYIIRTNGNVDAWTRLDIMNQMSMKSCSLAFYYYCNQ
jgi:hypothetical protein